MDQPWSCHKLGSCPLEAFGFSVLILQAEFSFSLAHPMVLLGGDYSGAVSECVGRDFGWRKWKDGAVSPEGAVCLEARMESQDALFLSHHCRLLLQGGGGGADS